MIDSILAQLIVILVITQTDFIQSIKKFLLFIIELCSTKLANIWKSVGCPMPPFDCALCCSFWTGVIFTFVNSQFTFVNLGLLLLISLFADVISDIFLLIKGTIQKILDYLYGKIS